MEEIQWPAFKFTEHVVTTCKKVNHRRSARDSITSRKVVRIVLIDGDATDSSDDESHHGGRLFLRRVKRHVEEINFSSSSPRNQKPDRNRFIKRRRIQAGGDFTGRKKCRGVRQRSCGGWAAEIRYPARGKRVCLGTYDTPEEASTVFDCASVGLKGPAVVANFHKDVPVTETVTESAVVGNDAASSPTSVLRYNEWPPFEFLELSDAGDFGFDAELALSLPCTRRSEKYLADEFGEFNLDDFINDIT